MYSHSYREGFFCIVFCDYQILNSISNIMASGEGQSTRFRLLSKSSPVSTATIRFRQHATVLHMTCTEVRLDHKTKILAFGKSTSRCNDVPRTMTSLQGQVAIANKKGENLSGSVTLIFILCKYISSLNYQILYLYYYSISPD